MKFDVDKALSSLTLEEKVRMLSGADFWHSVAVPEKGIGSFEVADGPYGIRKQKGLCDHLGWNVSEKATAYASGPGLASSFDTDLATELGKHLAAEARSQGVDVLLGPAVNIVRTPLCGRTFEYYSEDPCLAGNIASSYIKGVQSQGVGTCIKHFAANNQEVDREYIDARIGERALRELYLAVFEKPVKEAKPWSIMTALNKVNGDYCSENGHLIRDVLRKEWGYDGLVMSDWSGVNNRVRALEAGLDLEMPYSYGISYERVMKAVEDGTLDVSVIDEAVRHILNLYSRVLDGRSIKPEYLDSDHDAFSRRMAEKCAVLLKNNDSLLPLKRDANIAVIGLMAKEPRFKMEGSALVNPTRFDIPLEEIKKLSTGKVEYEEGYDKDSNITDEAIARAVEIAKRAEVAVLFCGLGAGIEAEGKDRKNIELPASHLKLIKAVHEVQKNTVVVLSNGSPVSLLWDDSASAILEMFLAGQCMGGATASLLYGLANPGGKLSNSFPDYIEQNSAYLNYPGHGGKVEYDEGVFVGYRYYETKKIPVRYPFGFGLSYTTFSIREKAVEKKGNSATLTYLIKNTGDREGSEVLQVYIGAPKGRIPMPSLALKAFARVYLKPGEEKEVSFTLVESDFASFDEDLDAFYAAKGDYQIFTGTSSKNILYTTVLSIIPAREKFEEITGWSTLGALRATPYGEEAVERIKAALAASSNAAALSFPLLKEEDSNREQINLIPLRMITVLTDNAVNNDIMDAIILDTNKKNLESLR